MKNILIFDSGVGGLSIYQEIQRILPNQHYIYVFDNAAFPYGELADDVLIHRTNAIIHQLVSQHAIDIVVIACNTASTIVLPFLRSSLIIPVVGVVPAIKPAAALSQTKHIGLLATPATVHRPYTKNLIDKFAKDCEVKLLGSTRLVEMAEDKLRGKGVNLKELAQILQPWKTQIDCIILGCTHFPLLKAEIAEIMGENVTIIDSGKAIAQRVTFLLNQMGEELSELSNLNLTYNTAPTINEAALNHYLLTLHLSPIQRLPHLNF